MGKVFVIAESAVTWLHGGLEAAYRSIRAAKECGADAWKTQWTSDPESMAMRRGVARDKYTRLGWAQDALPKLKEECDRVGIEFMCTVFIPKDVEIIKPYVKRFKISAYEGDNAEFISAHERLGKPLIISRNDIGPGWPKDCGTRSYLHCVSMYPTPPHELRIALARHANGLSDHTTSLLSGAVAVGAGCTILEKHVKLIDTPESDPDFKHSLSVEDVSPFLPTSSDFFMYVENVRRAEVLTR